MIRAAGVSRDVPGGRVTLDVVSVHGDAVNCADAGMRRWTLIADEADFQPRSILVGTPPALRRGERIALELSGASVLFDPGIPRVRVPPRWLPLLREWAEFIHEPELEILGRAAESGRVENLSGLGPGLTPAGDDFIAGWTAAQRSMGTPGARGRIRKFYTAWQPDKTTWLSKWMILDTVRGRVWKRGKELLSALSGDDGGAVSGAAAGILNWGHTSGRAWLCGLARGLIGEMILCKDWRS